MSAVPRERLQSAGWDLTRHTIEWGRPGKVRRDCRRAELARLVLTDRDVELLRMVGDFNYLTTSQIAALFWGRYTTAVKRRLKLLSDHGLVEKLRPAGASGRAEWIYRVAERGWERLHDECRLPGAACEKPGQLYSIDYTAHDLQVAGILVDLALKAVPPELRDRPLVETAPFAIYGPLSGEIDAAKPEPEPEDAWSPLPSGLTMRAFNSKEGLLKPDATITGKFRGGVEHYTLMFEYDRTERPSKQHDRYHVYDNFLAAGWRQSRYAGDGDVPGVIFVCSSSERIESFACDASPHLTAWVGPMPLRDGQPGTHPGRDEIAFTSRDRLLAGDWRMLQVPAEPKVDGRPCAPNKLREIEVRIPELFSARRRA